MFREIRRKDKIIDIDKIKNVLKSSKRGVISFNGDNGYPYAVPINFYYDEKNNCIYFHSSRAGYKIDLLKKSNKICFTACSDEMILEEAWAPFIQSVVVFGKCVEVDNEYKLEALKKFALKYYPIESLAMKEINLLGKACLMLKIEIDHISGKQIQEK